MTKNVSFPKPKKRKKLSIDESINNAPAEQFTEDFRSMHFREASSSLLKMLKDSPLLLLTFFQTTIIAGLVYVLVLLVQKL